MVLEHLFPEDWLEKKLRYAFLIALVYTTVAIIAARLLFASNSGLVAVVFTSILLLPYLQRLFKKEEVKELRERGSFKIRRFLKDNLPGIKVYGALFLGVYLAFMLYSFLLPYFGLDTGSVFREQLALEESLRGGAFMAGVLTDIFMNNWWVLLACFLLALLVGDGAIFFIVWNASAWGAIFGTRALAAAAAGVGEPLANLALIALITLPHLILEAGAYILAAIAGSLISEDVVSQSSEVPRFLAFFLLATLFYTVAIVFFAALGLSEWPFIILAIITAFLLLRMLSLSFDDRVHERVFTYNVWLFAIAIIVFLVGALVETFVLSNSTTLGTIYAALA